MEGAPDKPRDLMAALQASLRPSDASGLEPDATPQLVLTVGAPPAWIEEFRRREQLPRSAVRPIRLPSDVRGFDARQPNAPRVVEPAGPAAAGSPRLWELRQELLMRGFAIERVNPLKIATEGC